MSAVDLLSDVICQTAKVSVASLFHHPDFRVLATSGLLREAGVIGAIACMECEEAHAAEVVFDAGAYGYFCPDLGFINLSSQQIASVEPDLSSLIEHLANAFGCARRKTTPVHGLTWRIGALKTDHGDITLYFHPCLRDEVDALALSDALAREMASNWRLSDHWSVSGLHPRSILRPST